MRILITADLHWENPRSQSSARRIAQRICGEQADVLIVGGDCFALQLDLLRECLELFAGFQGAKLLVAGNHCLWVAGGGDSFRRYQEEIPEVAGAAGWHLLDHAPYIAGSVGIVGTVGWYDYRFCDAALGVPERFYRAKVGPGVARYLERYRYLVENCDDLRPEHFEIRSRWMDGDYIDWDFSDEGFTAYCVGCLKNHLKAVRDRVSCIVAVTHHVPFEQMVRRKEGDPSWNFANAFQGSPQLGEVLKAEPKVKYLVCGHVHMPQELVVQGIHCWNVGSGILRKRLVELAL